MSKEHDKVYAQHVLASNPPQRPWICRRCGAEGRDFGVPASSGSIEYERLTGSNSTPAIL